MTERADVVVVGLGPGGEEVAGRLAESGLDLLGIDGNLVGGECPYWGCIPSKMMIRAGNLLAETRRVPGMAGTAEVKPDWAPVAARIRDEATDNWNDRKAVERLQKRGGRFLRGWAKVTGPRTVEVDGQTVEATRALVLDTGGSAWAPPLPGLADVGYWTNRQAIECAVLPQSLTVLGGGAIGVELAQVFARFGVRVQVAEVTDRIVALEEPESSALLESVFAEEGIEVHTGVNITGVSQSNGAISLERQGGHPITGEKLLVATGRRPDLGALGVGSIGLDEKGRAIPTDDHMRVTDGVWAIGDVTGQGAFTHVSMYQAAIAIADILGTPGPGARYHALPRVTFTDPEVGSVGLTEQQARDQLIEVRTGMSQIPESSRGWIHKAGNAGFIKLVEDAQRRVLVGATSAGPMGGEVLGLLALAVHAEVPVESLRQMIYAYPTFHRAIETAVKNLS